MSKFPSKSHVRSVENAMKDGKPDLAEFAKDGADAIQDFTSGKETLLDTKRLVCHDGSVWDMIHHIATEHLPKQD